MNFFGHAAIASLASPTGPALVLGAMLPDFAGMIGGHVAAIDDAEVVAGVELHHRTDKAFHTLPAVAGLMRELLVRLDAFGCSRGAGRAAAHVGVELLLDGVWADDEGFAAAYLAALQVDVTAAIRWDAVDEAARCAHLLGRLHSHGVPRDLRSAATATARIGRALALRPLLRPSARDLVIIERALAELGPRIEVAAETVMRGVRARLDVTSA